MNMNDMLTRMGIPSKEFLGVKAEAHEAAYNAIIGLVYSDEFDFRTARQELDIRLKLTKIAEKLADGLNADEGIYDAREFAKREFQKRKEANRTYANNA